MKDKKMIGEPVKPGEIPFLDEGLSLLTKKYPLHIKEIQIPISEVMLNKTYDPLAEYSPYTQEDREWFREACGIIPDLLAEALDTLGAEAIKNTEHRTPTLAEIADKFDDVYMGRSNGIAFSNFPQTGRISDGPGARGIYFSAASRNGDEDPLFPIMRAEPVDPHTYGHFVLYVYDYGILALLKDGDQVIGRAN